MAIGQGPARRSSTRNRRQPAPVVEALLRGRSARYVTVIVPTRGPNERVTITNVQLTASGWSFDIDVGGKRERVRAAAWNSSVVPIG